MNVTITKTVSFEKLNQRKDDCVPVIQLMMACNDLTLANQALIDWKAEERKERRERKRGACMYFVRVELAHLYEGMKVIQAIRGNAYLSKLLEKCDPQTQADFDELLKFVVGGEKRKRFELLVGQIRNNLTFHYSDTKGKQIGNALKGRAKRSGGQWSSITRASSSHRWHWKVADDLVDSIVLREIWKIEEGANLRAETDLILEEIAQIVRLFLDFSGEFIWRYFES